MTDTAGTPPEPDRPAKAPEPGPGAGPRPADGTTQAPAPDAADAPVPDSTQAPAPDAGQTPAPDATQAPAPDAAEAPAPDAEQAPAPDAAEAQTPAAAGPGAGSGPDAVAAREDAVLAEAPAGVAVAAEAEGGTPGAPARKKRHWVRWLAGGAAVVVLVAAGTGWYFYKKLDGNITTDTGAAAELRAWDKERPTQAPVALDAQNILLIGSDTRAGGNEKYGRDEGTQRSDTTILLHLAADRKSATGVSLPRDLMVDIPSCTKADGTRTRKMFAQFNWAFEMGGTACTIRTVEKLTGIRIDHHMVVDFEGFKHMVDAVDGVDVCLKEPIDDKDAHLKLDAGPQTLNGEQALGYVRARKSIGGGSDTERMDRQQQFLGSLVNKMQSNGVLLNPTKLYPVLDAATKALTTDPGLDSLRDLYDLASSMRDVPSERVQFLTVPRQPYRYDRNRDELIESKAEKLFKQLREDAPVSVAPAKSLEKQGGSDDDPVTTPTSGGPVEPGSDNDGDGKPDDPGTPSPTPTPTFAGTNAARGMCE
ncbi:transcriptional regulator [Streptomyces spiroverticillatus]|uniref:Transcriptional regulator n=1 Tax=Streptomyces finlayi TaxID=67296 RepID=A0A919CFW8_9ACTN|nr:transcriptional regulator [Streptomyces spiroverticillatus]GHD16842.1 transcriptional regulator [Streptomyces finlayi]